MELVITMVAQLLRKNREGARMIITNFSIEHFPVSREFFMILFWTFDFSWLPSDNFCLNDDKL